MLTICKYKTKTPTPGVIGCRGFRRPGAPTVIRWGGEELHPLPDVIADGPPG